MIDSYWKVTGIGEYSSFRRYVVEDLLQANNIGRPSEIYDIKDRFEERQLIYFLDNLCVPAVMELMLVFDSSRSVIEERRQVCAILADLDVINEERHREEIAKLTLNLTLDEGVRIIDESRVYVDLDGMLRWAQKEIREGFSRFLAFQDVGIGFDRDAWTRAVRSFLVMNEPLPREFLSVPRSEADDLLLRLIAALRDSFLLNSSHGLDAYLSLRVRHGTLAGILRGPLEASHIIGSRRGTSSSYAIDSYWDSHFLDLSSDSLVTISNAISDFSFSYDKIIFDLRDRIHIRRKGFDSGLFYIELVSTDIYLIKALVRSDTTLDDFVNDCAELFWLRMEDRLEEVRDYIRDSVMQSIAVSFSDLESSLLSVSDSGSVVLFLNSIRQAHTDIQGVLENVVSWFERGATSNKNFYSVEVSIDIALQTVYLAHRNFSPNIRKTFLSNTHFAPSSLTQLSDILFILFDNVYIHSGLGDSPNIELIVDDGEHSEVILIVRNTLADDVDIVKLELELNTSRMSIDTSVYKTSAVNREGGTGLMKIKNLVDPTGLRDHALQFFVSTDRMFEVRVEIESVRYD